MGYRSEIYIVVDNELVSEFEVVLKNSDLSTNIVKVDEAEQSITNSTKYVGSYLKWYSGYKDVDAVNSFIDDNYEGCALLGIGDDNAESARFGSPENFDMYIVATVDW